MKGMKMKGHKTETGWWQLFLLAWKTKLPRLDESLSARAAKTRLTGKLDVEIDVDKLELSPSGNVRLKTGVLND